MTEWLSVPEFAKQVKKTPQYINRSVRNGKISEAALKPKGKRFLINPKRAIADMERNVSYINKKSGVEQSGKETEKKQTIKDAGLDIVPLAEAQKLQANYIAALKKIELEERQGYLLKKEDVEKDFFNVGRRVRDALLNIPDRISAELASITDTHVINDLLTVEISQALEELSS